MSFLYSRRNDKDLPTSKVQRINIQAAKKYIAEQQFEKAAACYERAGLTREAIDLLERNGLVNQAAEVLIKMGNYQRAGYLLARNNHFMKACEAFIKAKMLTEAATAAKKALRFDVASQLFLDAKQPLAAAKCFVQTKNFLSAARCFSLSNHLVNGGKCYSLFLKHQPNAVQQLNETDHMYIYRCLLQREWSPIIIKGILGTKFFAALTIQLLSTEATKESLLLIKLLLQHAQDDDLNKLISSINYSLPYVKPLASYLALAHQLKFAGIIWERTEDYERAALAFEQAGVYPRALKLYQQLGNFEAIKQIKAKTQAPKALQSNQRIIQSPRPTNPPMSPMSLMARSRTAQPTPLSPPKNLAQPSPVTIRNCSAIRPPKPYYLAHIFVDLNRNECDLLWEYGILREITANTKLYSPPEPAEFMAIILQGKLQTTLKPFYYHESDCLGELTMLTQTSQIIEAHATTFTQVFCLAHEEFKQFAYDHPTVAYKITAAYLSYLTETHRSILNVA